MKLFQRLSLIMIGFCLLMKTESISLDTWDDKNISVSFEISYNQMNKDEEVPQVVTGAFKFGDGLEDDVSFIVDNSDIIG